MPLISAHDSRMLCCSVMQCVAVCYSALQCVAVRCSVSLVCCSVCALQIREYPTPIIRVHISFICAVRLA